MIYFFCMQLSINKNRIAQFPQYYPNVKADVACRLESRPRPLLVDKTKALHMSPRASSKTLMQLIEHVENNIKKTSWGTCFPYIVLDVVNKKRTLLTK